jgi:hypothetical protein
LQKRLLLVPCLLIVSAFVLSACGGGGGSSDESQIEEAIETSATSSDPANCTELQTQEFAEQTTSNEGPAAVKECEAEAKKGNEAESVEVSNIETEGSEASAEAAFTGSSFDGQTLELGLVKEGGQWKLNEVAGFAKLDKPRLVEALAKQFESGGEVSEGLATCVEEGFEEASQPEIEELLLSGSSEPIEKLAKECSP